VLFQDSLAFFGVLDSNAFGKKLFVLGVSLLWVLLLSQQLLELGLAK